LGAAWFVQAKPFTAHQPPTTGPMPFLLQPRRFHPRRALFVLAVLAAFGLYTSRRDRPPRPWILGGETMGSGWSAKLVTRSLDARGAEELQARLQAELQRINDLTSTYQPGTDVMRFNEARTRDPVPVAPEVADVVREALRVSKCSGGAFDITFAPLFRLWGFGAGGPAAAQARALCGYTNLTVVGDGALQKQIPELEIILNAIVPGYAADRIASLLTDAGITNFLVDVGGENLACGVNLEGKAWRVGIERPALDQPLGEDLHAVVPLRDQALATSGDYRNYFKTEDGRIASHLFDPRAGEPASHHVASVSVAARSCMVADALATALFVVGPEGAQAVLTNYPGAAAFFVLREADNSLRNVATPGFPAEP
jgi:thiamine biosynthesis lipoprotein